MTQPRRIAFDILYKIENDSAYSNITINNAVKEHQLNSLDASFVSALVYGVLERKLTLDYIIKQYSKIPLRKIELKTKLILRLGILQMVFMDKIPDSAAVNESVNLAKKLKLQKSSGFINAILRNLARADKKYSLPDQKDKVLYYSIKYSCPQELVRLWYNSYGENNTVKLLENLGGRPEIFIRVNTLKTNTDELVAILEKEGVKAEKSQILENAVKVSNTGSIERLDAYKNGLFHVQDLSSQLCAYFLDAKENSTVLDVCSAPGGKSFTISQYMKNSGKLISCDMYEHKLKLIENGAKRLSIKNLTTKLRDACDSENTLPMADRVLCDVPCGGLGVLSRKPEIRYKADLIDNTLPQIQYNILCESSRYVKEGGVLVYSTCTLNPAENNDNTKRFLTENPEFEPLNLNLPNGINRAIDEESYEITLMPHTAGCDGFYISAFRRRSL